jgi:2-polyprenyl-6-methoxyphenol hydroxylase-like FAD-dependent oxidoreductase
MPAANNSVPAVIVGGGPVGMGLAIDLGLRGIKSVVVERYPEPQPIPKGQNLTQRTLEHFHFWGIEKELRASRTIPREYGIGGITSYGTLLSGYSYDWLQRELVRPFYFTENERLPQYATEAVLRRRAAQIPNVEVRYGWTCKSIKQSEHSVVAEITAKGDKRETLEADYVIGCDGSHSIIREQSGISQTISDHDRLMVLLVFRSTKLHQLLERYPGKSYYSVLHPDLEGYWKFFGRVDFGTTWFFHAPVPANTTRDNHDFRRLLFEATGAEFDIEIQHIGFWDLRFSIADSYRAGRVFVAGDAAHSHPPYGGYGINTGFEDSVNLSWKLAATLNGWGGTALLDSYDAERRPVFSSTASEFIEKIIRNDKDFLKSFRPDRDLESFEAAWNQRKSAGSADVNYFEPNYEGSPIVHPESKRMPSALGKHSFVAQAGHHLAPQSLSSGENVFEALGRDFTLIDLGGGETAAAFERAAQSIGVPLRTIADTPSGGREKYEAEAVLVRPDQFVAWAGSAGNPTDILKRAVGIS